MSLPTALQTARVVVTTGAANATADGDFGIVPGPNQRFRIWALSAAAGDPSQIPGKWRVQLTDRPISAAYSTMSFDGFGSVYLAFPGGLPLGAGVQPGWQIRCTNASITFSVYIYYTIEAVS